MKEEIRAFIKRNNITFHRHLYYFYEVNGQIIGSATPPIDEKILATVSMFDIPVDYNKEDIINNLKYNL